MSSHFVLSLLVICSRAQTYCLWGEEDQNPGLNGEYTFDGVYNGANSYVKSIDASCAGSVGDLYYLYKSTSFGWLVGSTKGSNSFNARCDETALTSCTTSNSFQNAVGLYAKAGSCPVWDCSSITIGPLSGNTACEGPFTIDQGDNVWSNADGSRFWYFVPHLFMWACSASASPDQCGVSYSSFTTQGWQDLSQGETYSDAFVFPSGGPYAINCLDSGGSANPVPTSTPTAPTTPAPVVGTPLPTLAPNDGSGYCLWGRSGTNSALNGLYDYVGQLNGAAYYVKGALTSCTASPGSDAYYVWRSVTGSRWYVTNADPSVLANQNGPYYATCASTEATLAMCSVGAWSVGGLYAQASKCPEWTCASVATTSSAGQANGCGGPFTTNLGPNLWANADETYFWYFQPFAFRWICNAENEQNACSSSSGTSWSYQAYAAEGWQVLSAGESYEAEFSDGGGTETIGCSGTIPTEQPSPSPTVNPSVSPSRNPAPAPTVLPSPQPTSIPSPQPSPQPTMPNAAPVTTSPSLTPSPTPAPTPSPNSNVTPSPNANGTPSPNSNGTPSPNANGTPSPNSQGSGDGDGDGDETDVPTSAGDAGDGNGDGNGDGSDGSKVDGGDATDDMLMWVVIGMIGVIVCCCVVLMVVWCAIAKKKKKEVYFARNKAETHGDDW